MLSFFKYFESLSPARQTIVMTNFIVASFFGSSFVCCMLDIKLNGRTSFSRGMKIAIMIYAVIFSLFFDLVRELSIPLKSLIFVSHYKYTRKQREFISFYVSSLCEYLQIEEPEIHYYKTRYTRIEMELTGDGVVSTLNIGTSSDSLQTLCHEIARELRRIYQLDRVNSPEFIKEYEDDEYIVEYLNKINKALELAPNEKDSVKFYKLFNEVDADGFATVVLNYLFRDSNTDNITVHYIERNDEEIPMEDIFNQAKTIMANEDVNEYLREIGMKDTFNELKLCFRN